MTKETTLYAPVSVEKEFPEKEGWYFVLTEGREPLSTAYALPFIGTGINGKIVTHWLKEVTLPTKEQVEQAAKEWADKEQWESQYESFEKGYEFLLNWLQK
jgi:hypothetical protein